MIDCTPDNNTEQHAPAVPPGLDWILEQWEQPVGSSGGDFIIVHRSPRTLRIFIGDVTGHGPAAARDAERVRPIIERGLRNPLSCSRLTRWSNAIRKVLQDRFVAFTVVQIDLLTGAATLAAGGNPGLIVIRADQAALETFDGDGMPLGLVDDCDWAAPSLRRIELARGDEIVCFTDGLTDMLAADPGPAFGIECVLAALANSGRQTTVQSLSATIDGLAAHSPHEDDLTVLWMGSNQRRAA